MADFLKILDGKTLANISATFNYEEAIKDFVGLKLLPMEKTANLKVAMYQLLKGNDIPVIALVHAFDSEARVGDRPMYKEIEAQLLLIKEKINQGEELRKKIKDMGMDSTERSILNAIYDDVANEITKVLTAFERRACELLSTGKVVVDENGAKVTIDFGFDLATNKIDFTGWSDPTHDIIGDIITLRTTSKNKIVRQIVSSKIMGYILANEKLNKIAENTNVYVTIDWAKTYIQNLTGIEMIVDDRTFKDSYASNVEHRFFDENTVISLTSRGAIGKTFMTSTPTEDANATDYKYGNVAVHQWRTDDPYTSWTKAEGCGLPVIQDINNTLYISKITA